MSFFQAEHLKAGYEGKTILADVSFQIDEGETVALLGANGSGKSTLLKTICNLLSHEGTCKLENASVANEEMNSKSVSRHFGYIPQGSGISIDISTMDVVLMGFNPVLGLLERPGAEMRKVAMETLEMVGVGEDAYKNFLHLSEGQKFLCTLARTLVINHEMLLLDEPERSLDFHHRYEMMDLLKDWVKQEKRACLLVLHDVELALNSCDKLMLLAGKGLKATIDLKKDSLEEMEEKLSIIYKDVSLSRCKNKAGQEQIVLLRES